MLHIFREPELESWNVTSHKLWWAKRVVAKYSENGSPVFFLTVLRIV